MADTIPLHPERVARYIGHSFFRLVGRSRKFVIAGSYPAAVQCFQFDGSILPYNNIDVFYQTSTESKKRIVNTTSEYLVIQRRAVTVNFFELGRGGPNLENLVIGFDCNAVQVGIEVTVGNHGRIRRFKWFESPHFEQFLSTRVLKIPDIAHPDVSPASAFIRLLYKSQQLRLRYKLPDERLLIETLGGNCFDEIHMQKLRKLLPSLKEGEIYSRFTVEEVTRHGKTLHRFHPRIKIPLNQEFSGRELQNVIGGKEKHVKDESKLYLDKYEL